MNFFSLSVEVTAVTETGRVCELAVPCEILAYLDIPMYFSALPSPTQPFSRKPPCWLFCMYVLHGPIYSYGWPLFQPPWGKPLYPAKKTSSEGWLEYHASKGINRAPACKIAEGDIFVRNTKWQWVESNRAGHWNGTEDRSITWHLGEIKA